MMVPAKKKRGTAIINGCADSSPILVAAEADAHRKANTIPAVNNRTLCWADWLNEAQNYVAGLVIKNGGIYYLLSMIRFSLPPSLLGILLRSLS